MTSRIQDHLPNLSGIVVATAISLLVGSVATHMVLEERLDPKRVGVEEVDSMVKV
jgi:hypothetical protein